MGGWVGGWMDGWMSLGRWVDGMDVCLLACLDGWVDGGWVDGGWING